MRYPLQAITWARLTSTIFDSSKLIIRLSSNLNAWDMNEINKVKSGGMR
jgi:hypothetical protein